ncbi:protein NIM1-INTERACTING 1-like [Juglans microcarpa x Juglans regia]|uniref:protein NIM1-INTERACTING 1-like n=1 Tax=Juglans microcarpa x Juglans regia TaxID=2249226 RepID=UPI001B7DF084|nr:protein NIM1-INTERACTING 1-like [Juglans microcarpa x Juglans regia]
MADNNRSSRIREDKREEEKEEEEEEDVKMENFFALIRSFREARNYYKRKEMNELEKKNSSHKKTKRVGGEQSSCNWVPKFEQEDFAREVVEFRRTPLIFPRPHNEEKNKKEGEDDGGLDLRLTL